MLTPIYVYCKALKKFSFERLYEAGTDVDMPFDSAKDAIKHGLVEYGAGSLEESTYSAEESQRIHAAKAVRQNTPVKLIWTPPALSKNAVYQRLEAESRNEVDNSSVPLADTSNIFSSLED